ncbi:MAG TPA: hypothetical protein VL359_15260 [bacterium]|nr:hypothetical protein [bacterium]
MAGRPWLDYPSVQVGLRGALVSGAVLTAYHLVNNLANLAARPQALLSACLLPALGLVYGWAGALATRRSGRLPTGLGAGAVAGFAGSVIGFATLMLITALFLNVVRQNTLLLQDFARSGSSSLERFVFEDALGGGAFMLVWGTVLGGACGVVGGWFARLRARSSRR